jgi:hypothetical protein
MLKAGRTLRTWAISMAATLAAAAAAAAPATPEVGAWLAANTDMRAAQVVIAGPDHVYTLEPLSPPTSAGEVIVLVRAEALGRDWSAANGSASWDAHLLFDCRNDRMREIRSAAYPGRNRQGSPRIEDARDGWTKPQAPEPAARLLAAACDPDFAWPLRTAAAAAVRPAIPPPPPTPSLPPLVLSAQTYAVQIARGPSAAGAQVALKAARKTLGPLSRELTDTTEVTSLGKARRYTVRLAGFRDAAAAAEACRKLVEAKQECFPWKETAELPAAAEPAPPPAKPSGYAVQIARGPSEEGAQKALKAARKALGASAEKLIATAELSHVGARRRYTALLSGFPSAVEAARACATLTAAGQTCFTLRADGAD